MTQNGMNKFRAIMPVIVLTFGIVSSYSFLQWQSFSHGQDIKECKDSDKEQQREDQKQAEDIVELKQDVKYISEDVKNIHLEQKEHKVLLFKIYSKLGGE